MRAPRPIRRALDWLQDLPAHLTGTQVAIIAGAVVGVAAIAVAIANLSGGEDESGADGGGTRIVTVAAPEEEEVGALGFPLLATRNTTRVGGASEAEDAAAVALATHPEAGDGVEAAVMVGPGNWQAGIAASVLAGPPLRAPILIGEADEVPEATAEALERLAPRGGGTGDAAVYTVGDVASPEGLASQRLEGSSAAEQADSIDRLRQRLLGGDPEHILVVSEEEPAFAMPAAAWAARSGDPVLFTRRDEVPEATRRALERHRSTPVYLLGPPSVISERVAREIGRSSARVKRIGAPEPVANAIAFARYTDGSFGWNINDPGHGLVIASADRPLDAAASAALAASGKWGPLLVSDQAATVPPDLRSFLLDIKPGYEDDPTRAVYNHIWIIGDASAIAAAAQAEIDELAELAPVGRGTGEALAGPSGPESEPQSGGKKG